ncbi:hypothetical protein VD0002_g8530 [Verticillium dahliae]|uniref:protein acetyllysine N-acetyltransferase n=2 Tax=Verticillium dahliae TaxID=27337 RepID=G2WZL1_VERDV|nr:NAD-dependent deacetylase sirtuin-7 [Verticillium dahliae VdLs.17]KAF3346627.1 hypothetical protein VdG2_05287 [Verticillium dahliae VDG2]KAH6703854.1 NAD-dependent deacetylase sirtuin-7 [Verticillium dahliae]EGY22013.1 NAD-dependent deacetylase sirtuin-7 [Verticillium dahliae VdLs.17]PNH29038.1 hypothetical protein BJF96_g7605 [Verticillium dahliae]PNH45355.1 hypothetical protein VD0003_g9228 [Verticillium dahliae]
MANTAPKIAGLERIENLDVIDRKAETLAGHIRKAKHMIAFTGAGVSTSAGIPDFRGPDGAWTLRAQGRERTGETTSTLQAIPTLTHMALVELQNQGILKYLVSQNCDGLHRRSGMLPDRISELHGNSNLEYCRDCGKEYLRDFRAVSTYEKSIRDHRTGRRCASCHGVLLDTIINFGETLSAATLQRARDHAASADLCLALGSSLTIPPACEIPEAVGRRRFSDLVICNLQATPLDGLARQRVFARTDDLMAAVMAKLGLAIPAFRLRRRLVVGLETTGDERHVLRVRGVDVDGTPATFLRSVRVAHARRPARTEPHVIHFNARLPVGAPLSIELEFMGHYGEPSLEIAHEYNGVQDGDTRYGLEYDPESGQWATSVLMRGV